MASANLLVEEQRTDPAPSYVRHGHAKIGSLFIRNETLNDVATIGRKSGCQRVRTTTCIASLTTRDMQKRAFGARPYKTPLDTQEVVGIVNDEVHCE